MGHNPSGASLDKGHSQETEFIRVIISSDSDSGDATKTIMHNDVTGAFDNFYLPLLNYFEGRLRLKLASIPGDSVQLDINAVVLDATAVLKRRLMAVATKILIREIHLQKKAGKLKGNNSVDRYDYYNRHMLTAPYRLSVLNKYPVLGALLKTTTLSTLDWVQEMIYNFYTDYTKIRSELGISSSKVKGLLLGLGDSHSSGKAVSIIVLDSGERLVYKPHAVDTEEIYVSIIGWLNRTNVLKEKLIAAKTLDCGGYGWQEYIESKTCNDSREADQYFYRSGALLALLHVCKAVDIHGENLIACGQYPVIVDLETLFSNDNPVPYAESMLTTFLGEVNDSVLGTMLLPQNFSFSAFDLDISALSGDAGAQSQRIRVNNVVNRGTDDIRIEETYYVTEEHANRAAIKKSKLSPARYHTAIEEGFVDCYQLICSCKSDFLQMIRSFPRARYRQIVRPTHIYYKFLEASHHPKYLVSFEARSALFGILYGEGETKGSYRAEKKAEVKDLIEGNVPYFTADVTTRNLYTSAGECIPGYFRQSLIEVLANRIASLDRAGLTKQLNYIRMSLVTTENDFWGDGHDEVVTSLRHPEILLGDGFLENACRIGDYLCETAIYSCDNTTCTWLTLLISKQVGFEMSALNYSIYEGAGVVLFLAYLGKETANPKYTDLAKAALKGIELLYHPHRTDSPLPLSAFWGTGSLVYLYHHLATLWGDNHSFSRYKEFINRLSEYGALEAEPLDFLGGLAGVVTLLINIFNESKDNAVFALACKFGEALYCKSKANPVRLTGLAHGYAGVAMALISLGKAAGLNEYVDLGQEYIAKENSYYDSLCENWLDLREPRGPEGLAYWCHGAAGIGLSRAVVASLSVCKSNSAGLEKDIRAAIKKVFALGFDGEGYSLCHGHFGNLDILLRIASLAGGQKELVTRVELNANAVLKRICADGLPYQTLGFMLGLSGIGYVLLRLNNNKLPCVLALDAAQTSAVKGTGPQSV